ncbi:hypothetical protein [Rhodococcus koreensis]|uniref:hypothetical protein n=1 Tax=Rhodococcus koreensis TaxID=99653 RepID=UPI00197FF236|nr:hypothetical protein [Rhodococcus koreensis]QSE84752.1 hypothetical protein JWS14_39435 [Rhodococcus koreensis]
MVEAESTLTGQSSRDRHLYGRAFVPSFERSTEVFPHEVISRQWASTQVWAGGSRAHAPVAVSVDAVAQDTQPERPG